jgi:glycolate oxidase iron-sulfur subunit
VANIQRTKPNLIATGDIGCITQIGQGTDIPIVHTVELLDWATGGPLPQALAGHQAFTRSDQEPKQAALVS